ncbi:MAG: yvrA [Bacilli bacterium]|nr:yvrA [Bacilli bacterium]
MHHKQSDNPTSRPEVVRLTPSGSFTWNPAQLDVTISDDCIAMQTKRDLASISSGIVGSGFVTINSLVNYKVDSSYNCSNPVQDLFNRLNKANLRPERSSALLTAAVLSDAGWYDASDKDFSLLVCATTGFSNSARAGEYLPERDISHLVGTVNLMVVIDGCLNDAAFVNSIITVTEAKSAALQDLEIRTKTGSIATGTTTDAIIVASTQNQSCRTIEYAGLATRFGYMLARCVHQATFDSGMRYKERANSKIQSGRGVDSDPDITQFFA